VKISEYGAKQVWQKVIYKDFQVTKQFCTLRIKIILLGHQIYWGKIRREVQCRVRAGCDIWDLSKRKLSEIKTAVGTFRTGWLSWWGQAVKEVGNSHITGRCELLHRRCYYFCLQTFQAVCPLSNWILSSEERWPFRKKKKASVNSTSGMSLLKLNDAACFLIKVSYVAFKNNKTTKSFFIL
jgi:hypothetical protein